MKDSPEMIVDRVEERRRSAQFHRIRLIALATADPVLVVIASFSAFYFCYDSPFFPLVLSAVFALPVWIGHRWSRRFPSSWSKKEPNKLLQSIPRRKDG